MKIKIKKVSGNRGKRKYFSANFIKIDCQNFTYLGIIIWLNKVYLVLTF